MQAQVRITIAAIFFAGTISLHGHAQTALSPAQLTGQNTKTSSTEAKLPVSSQVMKSIVFIKADCEPRSDELAKLTPDAIVKMKPEEVEAIRHPSFVGTGFLVSVSDERIGKTGQFLYLVTNRHVAQPGVEGGRPRKVVNYSVYLNRRKSPGSNEVHLEAIPIGPTPRWLFRDDDPSVDLAVLPVVLPPTDWEYLSLPTDLFTTPEMLNQRTVVEGDPVFFVGLFIQLSDFSGTSKVEPILRTGAIAELPIGLEKTTLRSDGHIYLVEVHSFGGNSGSPVFVDTRKLEGKGSDFKFLGVVAGSVVENNDLTLQVTTDYRGAFQANSGVSVVVPAEELRKLLFSDYLRKIRDDDIAKYLKEQSKP